MLFVRGAAKEVWTVVSWLTGQRERLRLQRALGHNTGPEATSALLHPTFCCSFPFPLASALGCRVLGQLFAFPPNSPGIFALSADVWYQQAQEQATEPSESAQKRSQTPTRAVPEASGTQRRFVPMVKCKPRSLQQQWEVPTIIFPVADTPKPP